MTRQQVIEQRLIGAQAFAQEALRALEANDNERKRPETTKAREVIKRSFRTFQLKAEQELNPMPKWDQVAICCALSLGVIGMIWGVLV